MPLYTPNGGAATSGGALTSGGIETAAKSLGQRLNAEYLGRMAEVGETATVGALVDGDAVATAIGSNGWVPGWDTGGDTANPALRVLRCRPAVGHQPEWLGADTTTVTVGPGSDTGAMLWVEFDYTGSAIDLLIRQGGTGGFEAQATVWVDGRPVYEVTQDVAAASGVGGGGRIRIPITFADPRRRLIALEFRTSFGEFIGADVQPSTLTAYPTGSSKGPRVLVAGDSYGEGGSATPDRGFVGLLPLLIPSWRDVWNGSSGSTGYAEDGARVSLVDRYTTDIVDLDPNIVIVAAGINDQTSYLADPAPVLTAATTVWDGITAALPNVELIVVGPFFPRSGAGLPAEMAEMDAALRGLAVERGLRYISPITGEWITGTGHVGAPASDGNADLYISSDGTHPSAAGHAYLAWRLAGHLTLPQFDSGV